jgi:hypothetical protein
LKISASCSQSVTAITATSVCSHLVFAAVVWVFGSMAVAPAIAAEGDKTDKRVRFVSPDGAVDLQVARHKKIRVKKGGHATFVIRSNELRYTVSHGNTWLYRATVDLQRVEQRTINLKIPGSYVMVVNRSDEPREIIAGPRHFGILKRGASKTVGPIAPGVQYLKTIGVRSRTHVASVIENLPGGFGTVVINSTAPGLIVRNPIHRRVRGRVDNRDYGNLEGGAKVRILGLAPGHHQIELIDSATGRPYVYDAEIRHTEVEAGKSAMITLRVDNRTGELLTLPDGLGGLYPKPLQPGDSVAMTLPRKRFKLRLNGKESALVYDMDIDPRAGANQSWWITRPRGQLLLTNGTGEVVSVRLDKFGVISLPIAAKIQINNVPAGHLQLNVETGGSKKTFERGIELKPGGDVQWTVTTGRSVLLIKNLWAEPVDLAIDGSPRGRVGSESTFRIGTIEPGLHTIVAQTLVSKVREVVDVKIVDGDTTTLLIRPPLSSLRLNNEGNELLRVVVRGREQGTVKPGESATFAVRSGRMAVDVRSPQPNRAITWFGTLAPAQQIVLPNPVTGAAPVIVKNPFSVSISVRIDAREPIVVSAHGQRTFSSLLPGAHLVQIKAGSMMMRQRIVVRRDVPPIVVRMPTVHKMPTAKKSPKQP